MTRLMKGLDEFLERATRTGHCSTWRHGPKTPDAPSTGVFLGVLMGRKGSLRPQSPLSRTVRRTAKPLTLAVSGGYPGSSPGG